MIWTLLRQDPAFRTLLVTLPATIAVALFTRGLLIDVAANLSDQGPEMRFAFLLGWINLWGLLVLLLYKSHFWVRCSRLNLTLPLRPKTVWLIRMGALVLTTLIPISFLTLLLALRLPTDNEGVSFDLLWIGRGVHLGLGAILALVFWHLPSPRLYRAGSGRPYFAYALFVAVAVFVFVRVLPVWSVFTLLAALLTSIIGARVYLLLPTTFALVNCDAADDEHAVISTAEQSTQTAPAVTSTRAEDAPAVAGPGIHLDQAAALTGKTHALAGTTRVPAALAGQAGTTHVPAAQAGTTHIPTVSTGNTRALTALTGLRLAHNHTGGWLIIGVICLYSALLAHGYHNGRNLGPYAMFVIVWVWFTINQAVSRMRNLDPLPLSRRYLFAIASLPALAAIVLGIGLWQLRTIAAPRQDSQVRYARGDIKIPPEFWEIAHEADVPTIESPWGETHRPRSYRVVHGNDLVVYNPYEPGEDRSPRFVAFQFERAIEAVHGIPILTTVPDAATESDQHVLDTARVLVTDRADAIESGESPVEGPPATPSPYRSRVTVIGALISILFGTFMLFVTMQSYGSPVLKKVYMGVVIGFLALCVASVIGSFFVDIWGITPPEVLDAFPNILLRKTADRVPFGTTALGLIAAATFVGCYLLIQNRFGRAELFAKKTSKLTEEF